MKILIVDDNEAVQEIIRDILVERDHNVRLASTVDEAVEKIKSFEPDVVMLDSWVGEECTEIFCSIKFRRSVHHL